MDAVGIWFRAAAGATTAAGFAIGRTVYFEPAAQWLLGKITREVAVAHIAGNYEAVIAAWQSSHSSVAHPAAP